MTPKKRTTRASPATTTTTTTPVTNAQLKALIDHGVADALATCDVARSMNSDDSHDSGPGVRRQAPLARECTYPDFIKCKPLYFKGTEGVVELTQWFERMEIVFRISNYSMENQIKFATHTLLGRQDLKKMITIQVLCPSGEFKKTEVENVESEESDRDREVSRGSSDISESVMASKPKTMQDAFEFATELMDKKISTFAEHQAENKRKLDNNNQAQQQPPKKQGVAIA
ncbi:hypothetical protein Tco_0466102 [Tanacetum coccineum]